MRDKPREIGPYSTKENDMAADTHETDQNDAGATNDTTTDVTHVPELNTLLELPPAPEPAAPHPAHSVLAQMEEELARFSNAVADNMRSLIQAVRDLL